jgi:hypothetical protein
MSDYDNEIFDYTNDNFFLILCTKCEVHHYENCPECFGFGYYKNKNNDHVPIPAGEAEKYRNGKIPKYELRSCSFCNSDIWGHKNRFT